MEEDVRDACSSRSIPPRAAWDRTRVGGELWIIERHEADFGRVETGEERPLHRSYAAESTGRYSDSIGMHRRLTLRAGGGR